jgi:hypothetical protein
MSDETSPERQALDRAHAELERVAGERKSSALDHVKAAIADLQWIQEQGLPPDVIEQQILYRLGQVAKYLAHPRPRRPSGGPTD